MKKIIFFLISVAAFALSATSCRDMLDTQSDRVLANPALDQKTDSMYYTLGILKSVQQLADQLLLINEMRGDLVTVNSHSSRDLQSLADFSADISNKYDSAYRFYRVINNCNYYIAHRDTALRTSSTYVTFPEYAQALAIRAWTYMQLAKIYGEVPFYTHPVLTISDAEAQSDKKDLQGIADALLPQLDAFKDVEVPNYGDIAAGNANDGTGAKEVHSELIMFPVDLVMGDLYLETNRYMEAANCYFRYLQKQKMDATKGLSVNLNSYISPIEMQLIPRDFSMQWNKPWNATSLFSSRPSKSNETITYIPMAVNSMKGQVSDLPEIFGYDYYTTGITTDERYLYTREVNPSDEYYDICKNQTFYYPSRGEDDDIKSLSDIGDSRCRATWTTQTNSIDSIFSVMEKAMSANVFVYRTSTVYLRLAEALNRAGYPDAAFAILKDGMSKSLLNNARYALYNYNTYMRQATLSMLESGADVPFLSTANSSIFQDVEYKGIHSHGCYYVWGQNTGYQYRSEIIRKWNEQQQKGLNVKGYVLEMNDIKAFNDALIAAAETKRPDTLQGLLSDSIYAFSAEAIDAVEDLICDEYALELACEGHRYGDLLRIARHKNASSPYGANYGSMWLANKLAAKKPKVSLIDPKNWYLPMK